MIKLVLIDIYQNYTHIGNSTQMKNKYIIPINLMQKKAKQLKQLVLVKTRARLKQLSERKINQDYREWRIDVGTYKKYNKWNRYILNNKIGTKINKIVTARGNSLFVLNVTGTVLDSK